MGTANTKPALLTFGKFDKELAKEISSTTPADTKIAHQIVRTLSAPCLPESGTRHSTVGFVSSFQPPQFSTGAFPLSSRGPPPLEMHRQLGVRRNGSSVRAAVAGYDGEYFSDVKSR